MKTFAIDVMSGDNDPKLLLEGCIKALRVEPDVKIVAVGESKLIDSFLKGQKRVERKILERLTVQHSGSIITMNEHPAVACRKKLDSTVMIGAKLLKEKKVDGFFSPGNTGASLAASLYTLGRLKGVKRPAIAVFIPTKKKKKKTLLLDAGANMDCNPKYLKQFAIMGVEYYNIFFDKRNSSFGLLNIGEEIEKGNDLSLASYKALRDLPYHFKGNVEPKAAMGGDCDVVVCDGFVGNIFLKTCEATATVTLNYFKEAWKEKIYYKFGIIFLKKKFQDIKNDFDPSEIGCAPLIGVDGNVFIGHGGTDDKTIVSAVKTMLKCVRNNPLEIMRESIKNYG